MASKGRGPASAHGIPIESSWDRVVKKSEKDSLYAAMDVPAVWLERALSTNTHPPSQTNEESPPSAAFD